MTTEGMVAGISGLLLGLAPLLAWLSPENPWLRRGAMICLTAWLGITAWLIKQSPSGHARTGARIENRYIGGHWNYQQMALGAVVPEVDQFMLGFRVVPLIDPLLTYEQARGVAGDTRAIYAELEADPDFHALGSVLPDGYSELWGASFERGHYFLYVPPTLDRRTPAPALVFLHGSGGNFKAYTWLLSKVADERGMVLIAPTFGFGNWDTRHGPAAIQAALDDASKAVSLDTNRVHLAGLSNGGLGVTAMAASEFGGHFRSLILLSPVCDLRAIELPTFASHWRGRSVLVISGATDNRVPPPYVKRCVEMIRDAGATVDLSLYPQANHFLVFSHRDRFLKELSEWLKKN